MQTGYSKPWWNKNRFLDTLKEKVKAIAFISSDNALLLYIKEHPNKTRTEIAKALNLTFEVVDARWYVLAGLIASEKEEHGFTYTLTM